MSLVVRVCIAIKLILKKAPENVKISVIWGSYPLYFVKHYFNKLIIFYTIKSNLHAPILLPN